MRVGCIGLHARLAGSELQNWFDTNSNYCVPKRVGALQNRETVGECVPDIGRAAIIGVRTDVIVSRTTS